MLVDDNLPGKMDFGMLFWMLSYEEINLVTKSMDEKH